MSSCCMFLWLYNYTHDIASNCLAVFLVMTVMAVITVMAVFPVMPVFPVMGVFSVMTCTLLCDFLPYPYLQINGGICHCITSSLMVSDIIYSRYSYDML